MDARLSLNYLQVSGRASYGELQSMVRDTASGWTSPGIGAVIPVCLVKGTGLLTLDFFLMQTFGVLNCPAPTAQPVRQPSSLRRRAATITLSFPKTAKRL